MTSSARTAKQPVSRSVDDRLAEQRLLPIVVLDDAGSALPLATALTSSGLGCLEVTLRTDAGLDAIARLTRETDLMVGAGTVLTPGQVQQAADSGAEFILSPGFNAAVVAECQQLGLPVYPGVATATEVQMALNAGIDVVKLFPAALIGGLPMLHALSAPFPFVRYLPTGGITANTMPDWIADPHVLAVGGTWIAPRDLLSRGDFAEIRDRAVAAASAARRAAGRR
jgi:2-dehydro-3-deoxyphosphogluconate aldolase/(4S)-4-hydroxy-2-oxoglutarate aldolase